MGVRFSGLNLRHAAEVEELARIYLLNAETRELRMTNPSSLGGCGQKLVRGWAERTRERFGGIWIRVDQGFHLVGEHRHLTPALDRLKPAWSL